ncbi:SURF1 family protein [Gammaproteobacteria bacterium]|nr:SURF1 family protein [Gammaproteobacteria bacterium]
MILFVVLSLWQVQRAYSVYNLKPQTELVNTISIENKHNLKQAKLQGHFLPYLFIQPRSHQHKAGYLVWVPFQTQSDWVLISLGFMHEPTAPKDKEITGTIRFIPKPFRLTNTQTPSSFPAIVGQLDLELFSQSLPQKLAPYVIIANGANELALKSYSDDQLLKHVNYALQFLLIGIILCYGLHRLHKSV